MVSCPAPTIGSEVEATTGVAAIACSACRRSSSHPSSEFEPDSPTSGGCGRSIGLSAMSLVTFIFDKGLVEAYPGDLTPQELMLFRHTA